MHELFYENYQSPLFVKMVNNQASVFPPPSLNVQKFAESRASELQSLHSIISSRLNNDFRAQRNKRRRTTGHDNRVTKKRFRKKQKIDGGGVFGGRKANDRSEKDEKKVPRRILRRIELKKNPQSGYSTCGDGTKRLRTHVWHAKRFTMTKVWGFYLPLGLHGRGRGSRALLKKLKQGVLVHDASYYGAVQLEGPEDSLVSVLGTVLVPYPSTNCHHKLKDILSGITYGTAMLHHYGGLFNKAVAPITYMWRPQHKNADSSCLGTALCDEQEMVNSCVSARQLWVWIHPAAFREGYDVLKAASEKINPSVICKSLENELAQLELIGLSSFQLIQKILHPVVCMSGKIWPLKNSLTGVVDNGTQLEESDALKNEDDIPSSAIISLMVNDPRALFEKETVAVSDAKFPGALGNTETGVQGSANFPNASEMSRELLSSFRLTQKEGYHFLDLWDAYKGIIAPLEERILCKKRHFQRMKYYHLNEKTSESLDHSEAEQSCQFCPVMLLKNNNQKGSITRWTIILPLSWVRAFWASIVSKGASAIGLRERHWVSCEVGLPCFPSDFPDTNAYPCYMATEAANTNKQAKLHSLRLPILPPWSSIEQAVKKKLSTIVDTDIQLPIDNSTENPNCKECGNIGAAGSHGTVYGSYIVRTSSMLTQFLRHINCESLLLFPYMPDMKRSLLKVMKDEEMINQQTSGISQQVKYCQKLCFVRLLLHAFSVGVFEEGATVCAPDAADISLWSRSENDRGKLQVPVDPELREFYRCPIGYITTGFVRGSKRPVAVALCEAVSLAQLRGEQWKIMSSQRRSKEIYVLVRNSRSTAYRLALASIVLESQEEDTASF